MGKKPTKKKPLSSEVNAFLAAPDSVIKSDQEKRKLLIRKAKLQAAEEQLKRSKSTDIPTIEDILEDLIRVASDKDTNPHHLEKSLSRKRYVLFGHYPIEFIDNRFGQFEHAKQVAGLEDQPGTRLKKAAIAENSKRLHAARYLERYIQPYVVKDADLNRDINKVKLILSISDTHATFLDPFTWYCFLHAIQDLKPDMICFNGDILEGSEISRFPKIPGWTVPFQLELDFARTMFQQVRSINKEAEIVWTAGNHGLDRIASYLTQVAPAFASLRSLRFDELLDLEGLGVQLAQGGSIASPKGQENDAPGILVNGFYRIHHGTMLGENPGLKEMRVCGLSGQSGHVHRASLSYNTTEFGRTKSWLTTPMGCTHRAGRSYMKGVTTGWQRGFGVAFLFPDQSVHQYPVITDGDKCLIEGHIYSRPKNLPDGDPNKLWLTTTY